MFDWAGAIERNHTALAGILTTLFAMLGLKDGTTLGRIERQLYRSALRILRPAEAAVRRLIVIAARGLVVKPVPSRPISKDRVIAKGSDATRLAFALFDTRKRFAHEREPRHTRARFQPHVHVYPYDTLGTPTPPPAGDGLIDARRLGLRLQAMQQALADLPRQAKRLARWRTKREAMASPKFTSPLRIGRPPGHRKKPTHEVDHVLAECHWLAREVERADTS